jgi:hypothetical protein
MAGLGNVSRIFAWKTQTLAYWHLKIMAEQLIHEKQQYFVGG